MNLNKIEKWLTIFFISASIFISVLLIEAVILALFSQFKPIFIYLALIPSFIIVILFSIPLKRDVKFLPKITVPVLILIILVSFILIFYPHDTFGGRDESNYINTATHLAKTASLEYPSYLNNLSDKFVESIETTPPAYTVWLATQRNFFGIQGLLHSNLILIILGFASFFLVSSCLGGNKIGFIATVLFSSSMPFLWFSRETMTENLAFFLLWIIILFLLFTLKTKNYIYLIIVFICSWLFALTRLEGFLLQFILLLIIPFTLLFLRFTSRKNILYITFLFFLVVISNVIFARNTSASFLVQVIPSVEYNLKRDISTLFPKATTQNIPSYTAPIRTEKKITLYNKMPIFFALMLAKYNFLLVIFSIFLLASLFLIQRKKHTQTKFYYLLILIVLIPELYKLISPGVTIDEPWLYRRYIYALLPFGYISLCLFLKQCVDKKFLILILSAFLLVNIALSSNIITLKNNWMLIDKLNEITKDISQNDFVIIRERPLGYYSPGAFLILNKEVRTSASSILWLQNFFPEKKIFNGVSYNKIFLLSAKDKDSYPSFRIASRRSVDVKYIQLIPSCQLYLLGEEEGSPDPYNIGLLTFSSVEKYCSKQKNEIIKHKEKLYLYELIYKNEEK